MIDVLADIIGFVVFFANMRAAYATLLVALVAYTLYASTGRRWLGRAGTGVTILTWCLLTATLLVRGIASGHWPLSTQYEFVLGFVWLLLAIYLALEIYWRERRAGTFVLGITLILATYAVSASPARRAIGPLLPVLRSVWLQAHVLTAMVGYAAFGVAAGLGLMHLAYPPEGSTPDWLPPLDEAEQMLERVICLGFPWLSLGILTGAFWAQMAWGRYWGWDPKETWALVTWLWYAMVLHLRPLRRWRGRKLAALVVAGFGIVCFTFVGVPWLVRTIRLESLHGF